MFSIRPQDAASSAYHIGLVASAGSESISGKSASAYMGIAKGSPWVVPSSDKSLSPSMNRLTSSR